MRGIDANQDITDDVLTGDNIRAFVKTAAEAPPGIFAEAFGPIGDGPVSAHSTQASSGYNGQNGGNSMPSPLGSARIRDFGKNGREGLHLLRLEHHFGTSCTIRWREKR